jgi:exosortase/archaeosortase family protein
MSPTDPALSAKDRRGDLLYGSLLFLVTALVFLPATLFLVQTTIAQEQLYTSLTVLVVMLVIVWRDHDFTFHVAADLGKPTLGLLGLSFVLLGLQLVFQISGLAILAFLCAIAAFLLYVMGERFLREVSLLSGAFALFVFFALSIQSFDWPLRRLAGGYSGWMLQLFGLEIDLTMQAVEGQPGLFLISEGRPFFVAAECNGFGMISAAALMAVLIAMYRQRTVLDSLLMLAAGGFIGFVGNTLRIFVIVMLAPHVSDYMLMHEIVGIALLYSSIGVIYWLFAPPRKKPAPTSQ